MKVNKQMNEDGTVLLKNERIYTDEEFADLQSPTMVIEIKLRYADSLIKHLTIGTNIIYDVKSGIRVRTC